MSKYCLICSAARSGSTLLDLLVGGHPNAASLGEFSFLGKAIALNQNCSCGQPVSECESWKKVIEHVKKETNIDMLKDPYKLRQWDTKASVIVDGRQQTKLYLMASKLRSGWCDLSFGGRQGKISRMPLPPSLSKGITNTLYLYGVISSEWGKDLIIDSSKNVHKALGLYQRAPDKTKIVYLVRDGRGVYYSRRTSGFSRREAMSGWRAYNQRAIRLLLGKLGRDRVYVLRYEDLVGNLESSMVDLCRFLEIDYDSGMLELDRGERHLVNGNKTMFNREKGVKVDQRWKEGLVGSELDYFNARCGELNRSMGYRD